MATPGYFGHIELAKPVFYIQYISTIIKLCRCVCFKCSKLLISKEKYHNLLKNLNNEARWNKVFHLCGKVGANKRCGEDIDDGCGCKQPSKIKKEGLANITAEWSGSDDNDKVTISLTPELLFKMFKRISDEDVKYMGFSPTFSRPEWMICSVFAVPPPAVRPSVKHDSQQRSEDDISHILCNIIKTNKTLEEKIKQNAPENVINDWTTVLQYYIATLVDNKIPGVASVAQRSGRPLKSIKERLNGKTGRVRGNLMGKRVDYSARSVITPDPNLSIRELGVPLKIAMNITKPVVVNDNNKKFLLSLIKNGPDKHPGAKILEKKNGNNISLRYVDRESINLENGDIVHRHMMNGDAVLFNRQPTLHRMSMMCHIVKIMKQGDTFRMNVADTKPYNADFDGDEMNLHMPQNDISEVELKNLAAVPYQIISPAKSSSIVGIFQDSMVGTFRFTRKDIKFPIRKAMNLLMKCDSINEDILQSIGNSVSNFEILSQILPALTLKYKSSLFNSDEENKKDSNNILEIKNGEILRGNIEKGMLGSTSKGILQRICNDFGNFRASTFIDDLQNIITEYMKTSGYSVGISDLIADAKTNRSIIDVISEKKTDVKNLIHQTRFSVFENETGKTNVEEFETQVNGLLDEARSQSGIIGRKSLDKDNRFVIMVNAGSKGSEINISQMISCLGQQTVDGKRIPYGFDDRTLPHYQKYDDSPSARGFVENSFIGGLTPQELFFHAQGGRVGLIDTAVKTSQTGYIQRRLIKGMEDLKVEYDMTVRNNKNKIVQFTYGDDNFDTVKIEEQKIPLIGMSLDDIYSHFHIPQSDKDEILKSTFTPKVLKRLESQEEKCKIVIKKWIDFMIDQRESIMKHVFKYKNDDNVYSPVAFQYIIDNIKNQTHIQSNSKSDITPFELYEILDSTFETLENLNYIKPNMLFKTLYYYYLSPKELLIVKRYNKKSIIILLENIVLYYKKAIIPPGDVVGLIAAQSIGEPTTQMTLNTFHFAGVASKSNVTRGVPRVEEILSLSENPKQPSATIYLKTEDECDKKKAQNIMNMIEHTRLEDIISSIQICFDPETEDNSTQVDDDSIMNKQFYEFEKLLDECSDNTDEKTEKSNWIIRIEIDAESLLEKNINMEDVHFAIKNSFKDEVSCVFTDYNSDKLIFRLRLNKVLQKKNNVNSINPLDQSDEIYLLKNFQDNLIENVVLRGIKNIDKVLLRKDPNVMRYEDGKYNRKDIWLLDTVGSNLLDILALDYIDTTKTYSNDIQEMYKVFGIEVARQCIYNEFTEVMLEGGLPNTHHLSLLCDRMTYSYKMISIFRHGINNDDIGPIAKASFEETPEMFLKAARHAELDIMRGVSSNVMCGQEGYYGTNSFQIYLNLNEITSKSREQPVVEEDIDLQLNIDDTNDPCKTSNIIIENTSINIKKEELGDDDYIVDL
jgi:DNA-directed RNA polymerase II subunit RPB1